MKNSKLSIAILCALGMVFSFQEITAQTPQTTPKQEQTRQSTPQQDRDRLQEQRRGQVQETPQQRQENRERYNQRMFTHLNMTDDQIRQFNERERELQRSQRGSEMNREQMQNRRNEIMRGILNPDQFTNYETWSRSNPQDF